MEKITVHNGEFFERVVEMLEAGKRVTIPVKGTSMLPFIRGERDLVVLEQAPEYREWDIVLFLHGGHHVLHRIVAVDGDSFTIMGDGSLGAKEHVTKEAIFGKAIAILRDGKKEVDPSAPRERHKARRWRRMFPLRRYMLGIYRRVAGIQKWW